MPSPHLLAAAATADDRALQHSITYALIEMADPAAVQAGLASTEPKIQAVALIALDQIPGAGLQPNQVVPRLDSQDATLERAADWLIARHPEWGGELADWLRRQLTQVAEVENTQWRVSPLAILGDVVGRICHASVGSVLDGQHGDAV